MKKIALAVLIGMMTHLSVNANPVKFYDGDFEAAKLKAADEGKMIFVDFYANWCMPCKWMDQTTFSDPQVGEIMNDNFISVKVNIDDFDGFELTQKYAIQVLPTLLIFDQEGKMVDRIEETMAPAKMITLLTKHHKGVVDSEVRHNFNKSPRLTPKQKNDYRNTESRSSTYKLQMGVYGDYQNAASMVSRLQDLFLEPIIVVNEVVDHKVYFKIMMGHFVSLNEAESFKAILKNDFSLESIVM